MITRTQATDASPQTHSPAVDPIAQQTSTDWDELQEPWDKPIQYPAVDYLLVGPPNGIASDDDHEYTQTVTNPEDLNYYNWCNRPPIDLERPDGLAPIGVYGANMLTQGQFLFQYQYSRSSFSGVENGSSHISNADVLATYPLSPDKMTQEQNAIMLQYAVTDDLNLVGKLPYVQNSMNFVDATGATTHTSVTDPGDVPLSIMYSLKKWNRQQLHINLGVSVPLGVFDRQGQAPIPGSPEFTYPMRTSSGTYDFLPGLTYRGQSDYWTWGAQTIGTVRTGRNHFNYRLGDSVELNAWATRKLTENFSSSFRLNGQIMGNIHGQDSRLDPTLTPTNDTGLQAYQRLNALFGLNYYLPGKYFANQRFSVEGGIPMYQHVDGPQPRLSWLVTAGWQLMF